MELGERKKKILTAIINDYIKTAEPVGSRAISKNHGLDISSATIRNEMADLEEMGYLDKPHTSAGRTPSNLGYRFYVDSLMNSYQLTISDLRKLREVLENQILEIDDIIAQATDIVSELTNYTVIAATPVLDTDVVKIIKLLPLGCGQIILAVVTSSGISSNKTLSVLDFIEDDYIYFLSDKLNENLKGRKPEDVTDLEFENLCRHAGKCPGLMNEIFDFLYNMFNFKKKNFVYTGGISNIFNHPEYKDLDKARDFIRFLGKKDNIKNLLDKTHPIENIKIIIGDENTQDELKECSVVLSNYKLDDKLHGSIGIIGPKRMDYAKVISSLSAVTERLNLILYKMFYNEE